MGRLASIPAYPVLTGLTFVLSRFLDSWAPANVLGRPLLVAVLLIIIVQSALGIVVRNRDAGAFLATLLLLVAFDRDLASILALVALVPLLVGAIRTRRVVPLDWGRLTGFLNLVTGMMLILTVARTAAIAVPDLMRVRDATPPAASASANAPDIYLILLDAYPRADTLTDEFDFDNARFLASMEGLGFAVADASRANYDLTPLTLISMLNMQQVDRLMPDPPSGVDAQAREISRLIGDAAGIREARKLGYQIVAIPSPVPYLTMYAADRVLDSGRLNEFEHSLFQAGGVLPVLRDIERPWAVDQHRLRILDSFAHLRTLAAEEEAGPRLVFAHILAPHLPVVFGVDGSSRDGPGCLWQMCPSDEQPPDAEGREAIRGQIAYVNDQVLSTVERIIDASRRPAVVVIFSDHGLRLDPGDRSEMLRNLFLSYAPGQTDLFPTDASPVNILPRILNAYLGAELPLASEESYWIPLVRSTDGFFPLERWTP